MYERIKGYVYIATSWLINKLCLVVACTSVADGQPFQVSSYNI